MQSQPPPLYWFACSQATGGSNKFSEEGSDGCGEPFCASLPREQRSEVRRRVDRAGAAAQGLVDAGVLLDVFQAANDRVDRLQPAVLLVHRARHRRSRVGSFDVLQELRMPPRCRSCGPWSPPAASGLARWSLHFLTQNDALMQHLPEMQHPFYQCAVCPRNGLVSLVLIHHQGDSQWLSN